MNNWQDILLFPVKDTPTRQQFLIACLIALAGFIILILPTLLLPGYSVKIMRPVLEERKKPSMPNWQESDWSAMLLDGLRLLGLQLILILPFFILMAGGFIFTMSGATALSVNEQQASSFAAPEAVLFFMGIAMLMLFRLLFFPYSIIISAAVPHAVAKNSFSAGLPVTEWFPIFRKGLVSFILAYAIMMIVSFVFVFVMQVAVITIILMYVAPLLMIPYAAYLSLVSNTIYAQAYITGRDALQLEAHATA